MHSTPRLRMGSTGSGFVGEKGDFGGPSRWGWGSSRACGCRIESWVGSEGVTVPHPPHLGSPPKRGRRIRSGGLGLLCLPRLQRASPAPPGPRFRPPILPASREGGAVPGVGLGAASPAPLRCLLPAPLRLRGHRECRARPGRGEKARMETRRKTKQTQPGRNAKTKQNGE